MSFETESCARELHQHLERTCREEKETHPKIHTIRMRVLDVCGGAVEEVLEEVCCHLHDGLSQRQRWDLGGDIRRRAVFGANMEFEPIRRTGLVCVHR